MQISLSKEDLLVFITLFMFYSVVGAIYEHFIYYVSKTKVKVLNNPILTGFPLYGIAAYIIIAVHKAIAHKFNILVQFAIYTAIATLLEYVTGLSVGAGKTESNGYIKAWDYSNDPLNYRGIIKLSNSIIFGIIGLIITRIHPYLKRIAVRMFECK